MKYILWLLLVIASLAFLFGIAKACFITIKGRDTAEMPAFLASLVTSISAVLATNFGALLGLKSFNFNELNSGAWNPFSHLSVSNSSGLPLLAAYVYLIGLITAAIVWAIKNFSTDSAKVVSLIPELTKSLAGVIIGALAITLKVPVE